MRRLAVLAAMAVSAMVLTAGCATTVTGVALPDPVPAPVAITEDGFGIRAGFPDATAEVELYTAPGCVHCAELQRDYGEALSHLIATGQIAVTYRPLFFRPEQRNAAGPVISALFQAASPGGGDDAGTTGPQLERFVRALWLDPVVYGSAMPNPEHLAGIARSAGIPESRVAQIALNQPVFDDGLIAEQNVGFLLSLPSTETPTVYDVLGDRVLDVAYDPDWLVELTAS